MTYDPRLDEMADHNCMPIGTVLMYDGTGWVDDTSMCGWYSMVGGTVPAGKPADGCCIPDVRDKFALSGSISAQCGGANSLTLETCQLPEHSHCMKAHTHSLSGSSCGHTGGSHSHCTAMAMIPAIAPSTSNVGAIYGDYGTYSCGYYNFNSESTCHTHGAAAICSNATATLCDVGNSCTAGLACAVDNRPAYYTFIFVKRMY